MKLTPDDPRLTAYALGELPATEHAAVEAEVRSSPELRQAVEDVRQMEAVLARELAAETLPSLSPSQVAKVLATAQGKRGWLARLLGLEPVAERRWRFELALAGYAVVVTLALIAVLWPRSDDSPRMAAQPAVTNAVVPPPVHAGAEKPLQVRPVVQVPLPDPPPLPPIQAQDQRILPQRTRQSMPVVAAVPPPPPGVAPALVAMVPLPLQLPMPSFKGTPDDLPKGEHIEPFTDKPRAPFLAPIGVQNLALNKKVTSSDKSPITGSVAQITDGNKDAIDDAVVEMHKGVQWVQIDLERESTLAAIVLWHDHRYVQVFKCVVVQAADDPDFTQNVRTLFNNDYENVAGLGIGKDQQYFETNQGRLIDTLGAKARYLRFYSKGSNASALNCYTEIEVWGLAQQ